MLHIQYEVVSPILAKVTTNIPIKMSADEFVDCLFCERMTILEFVQRSKFLDVETVWQNNICNIQETLKV